MRLLLMCGLVTMGVFLYGCADSSGTGGAGGAADSGGADASGGATAAVSTANAHLAVALSNAAQANITAFACGVTSITLGKENGVVVSVLPAATTVDFAALTELGELVSTADLPPGRYTKMTIGLDFGAAGSVVTLSNGASTTATGTSHVTLQDAQGNALTSLSVAVSFPATAPLDVSPGTSPRLGLAFDLGQSATVDLTGNIVKVSPTFVATVDQSEDVDATVRGTVQAVDTTHRIVTLELHGFGGPARGTIAVTVDDQTVLTGDDVDHDGTVAFADLAAEPLGSAVVASVTFDGTSFTATALEFGAAAAAPAQDAVEGTVTAISGSVYTLDGVLRKAGQDRPSFAQKLTAKIDATTKIAKAGGSATPGDIGIGQQLSAVGKLDATAQSLDCTATSTGSASLELTQVAGTVVSSGNAALVVNVVRLGRLPVSQLSLGGVDPTKYTVSAPSLASTDFTTGPVVVSGYVTPGGAANFQAVAIQTAPDRPIRLGPGDGPPPGAGPVTPQGFPVDRGGRRWRGPRPF